MSETSVLNELVGEGKKFATPEDLAKGKKESDAFISTLQGELKDLRELVTTLGTENEQIKGKLTLFDKLTNKSGNPANKPNSEEGVTNQPKALTEEDVSNLLIQREQAQTAARNKATVDEVLIQKFGAEAKKFVKDQADALGTSVEELVKLAEKNPNLFYRAVGLNPNSPVSGNLPGLKSGSHTNVDGTPPDQQPRGEKWWSEKRKSEGHWKFATNKALNVQMHKDMVALGDKWKDY